jgi:hypothetical protein
VESNEYHFGGNIGAIATGDHGQATGTVNVSGAGDPLAAIDQLLRKLEADAGQHLQQEQARDVADDARRLHAEVHSRKPSLERVRHLLSSLSATAGSATALLAVVDQVKDLVLAIVH